MTIFDYLKTPKYLNFQRNEAIFKEESAGVFHQNVNSRIKLELMGAGAIVSGNSVMAGFSGKLPNYSPISQLIVPSTLLSSITSAYISYATAGEITFAGEENTYLKKKIKEAIGIQSVGGSALLKRVDEDETYINIYTPLSYFTEYDEFIHDKVLSHTIFNKVDEDDNKVTYMLEVHNVDTNIIIYRKIVKDKKEGHIKYLDTVLEGYRTAEDELGVYSFEVVATKIIEEVINTVFDGGSDYTDDNVALLRELVVTNTINSQTFDKISNPLLALPEEALEYDENGNAKVSLQDRVIIIRDGGNKPEQVVLDSKIEQAQIHKENIEQNIFSSLAVNKTALGLTDISQLSGEALAKMMTSTVARVIEKRDEVARGFEVLLDIEIVYSEVITPSFNELVTGIDKAVTAGIMSQEKGTTLVSGEEDWKKVQEEKEAEQNNFGGLVSEEE